MVEKIQNLPEKHRERVMGEYIKMKLKHRERRGWEAVNIQIRKKVWYFSKLKVKSLRQYIPYPKEQQLSCQPTAGGNSVSGGTTSSSSRTKPRLGPSRKK